MKTVTEFPGLNIKNASLAKETLLKEGKTPEELPPALGESQKVEGDRLGFLIHALEVVGSKLVDIKRVIVFTLAEGEKAPPHAVQKGEHYYLVEYFPALNQKKPRQPTGGPSGDPKGRKRKRKRGFDSKRGPKGDRQPRSPGQNPQDSGQKPQGPSHEPPKRPVIQPIIRPKKETAVLPE